MYFKRAIGKELVKTHLEKVFIKSLVSRINF